MKKFTFRPAEFIPFRDLKTIDRVRKIKRKEMTRHWNPNFRIKILPDPEIEFLWVADMFQRIKQASDNGRQIVLILPNPWPSYHKVARLINQFRVDCRKVHTFNMDE